MPEILPKFVKSHQSIVSSVAFSPQDRYLFCSGGCNGEVYLYSALSHKIRLCFQISTLTSSTDVNAVRFSSDGSKIVAATTARRIVVLDVERGENVISYDNCSYSGKERSGIASDPLCPNLVVSINVVGTGLTLIDLRMPLPFGYLNNIHHQVIRDVSFLHNSWPWTNSRPAVLTVAVDGVVNSAELDGRSLHQFHTYHSANTVCSTSSPPGDKFYSVIMTGGDMVTSYVPDIGSQEILMDHKKKSVWKTRYTSSGSSLYTVSEDGWVRKYRRYPDYHRYLGKLYAHGADIFDLDISPYDEYLVTASKDKTVGILHLGTPNHGSTEQYELT